jgi:hypothetical protein
MNAWEMQFYRQLAHAGPGGNEELPALGRVEADRHIALQAALRQALIECERVYSD